MIIQEENRLSGKDSTYIKPSLDSLCRSYKIALSQFDNAIKYYKYDLSRWKDFMGKVVKRLEFLQQEERANRRM